VVVARSSELPPVAAREAEPLTLPQVDDAPPSKAAAPGFDLAQTASAPPTHVALALPDSAAPTPATVEEIPPEPASLAELFAEFDHPRTVAAPPQGAVDITAIEPPREVAAPPPPPPPPPAAKPKPKPKPAAPSRVWVQVATGKDLKALAFDWRRFAKKAPDQLAKRSPFTTRWGESTRLLTGPYDSAKEAQQAVTKLKAEGVDAFVFTSDEGQAIDPLK
jgi:hypothetical protein